MHADVIISEVAQRMGVTETQLRARTRTPHVVAARHAAFWALQRAGMNPAEIARLLGLNHSSVVHGLARAALHPEWCALVAPAVELSGAGGQKQAVRSWLKRGLRTFNAIESQALYAYTICTILGWERHPGNICAYGLRLIMSCENARNTIEEVLRRCDLAHEIGRIDLHAALLGCKRAC